MNATLYAKHLLQPNLLCVCFLTCQTGILVCRTQGHCSYAGGCMMSRMLMSLGIHLARVIIIIKLPN
jgi:hypothetical protein